MSYTAIQHHCGTGSSSSGYHRFAAGVISLGSTSVYTALTKCQRFIFNSLIFSYMRKGKLTAAMDSETVEAEAVDAEAGIQDIALDMLPD